ncbi:MAG: hydratase [Chloroflexota bacterium]
MLDRQAARAASRLLVEHWEAGTRLPALPPELRPATRAEGYLIQAELMAHTAAPLFGWKIAATSVAGQHHIRVDGPLAGRLLAEKVIPDGATVSLATSLMRCVEVEFAFRMGRNLAPRAGGYAVDEVMAAVAALHPAIELPDSRFEDFTVPGAPQLIADDACAAWFLLGPEADPGWRELDLAEHPVHARWAGGTRTGRGGNALGDPRVALTWLVNELSGLGIALGAGEIVTTGTCLVPVDVVPGDEVWAGLDGMGEIHVRFDGAGEGTA